MLCVGLIKAEPTLSAIGYLNQMIDKYYWRVFGPTLENDNFGGEFDLASEETFPQWLSDDPEDGIEKYVRYGSISIFGGDSIVSAKIAPRKFDLRRVDPEQSFITWRKHRKEVFTEVQRTVAQSFKDPLGWRSTVKWKHEGEEI